MGSWKIPFAPEIVLYTLFVLKGGSFTIGHIVFPGGLSKWKEGMPADRLFSAAGLGF